MNIRKLKNFIFEKLKNELSEKLTFHGVNHTKHVLSSCNQYIKRMHIGAGDAYLLRTAALMHDVGFIWDFENHEEESIRYTRELLPQWNYSEHEIIRIVGMIEATRIRQSLVNVLDQILVDSDLDYLGSEYFYKIGNKLYNELLAHNKITDEKEFDRIQVKFLQNHHFYTPFAKKYREPVKQKFLKEIQDKWGW